MAIEQWLMVAIFAATVAGLIKNQKQPERVFIGATLCCLALSLVSVEEVLFNATNSGLVSLVLLIICSFALERTGFLRLLSQNLFRGSKTTALLRTLFSSALASAFTNNTAVVAALISPIKNNTLINPGKLLLPMSYAAILGGTLTLVGTSTNLIVNSLMIKQGQPGLGFFDFTAVGAVVLVCCMGVILLNLRVLPDQKVQTKAVLSYFVEAEVELNSDLIGKSIQDNGLRNLEALFLVEVIRGDQLITPVTPEHIIRGGDKLIFSGDVSKILVLQQFSGLRLFAEQDSLLQRNLTEVLLKPDSTIVGKTLKSSGFRARFDAAVVGIRREGGELSGKLGDITLLAGDFLVLAVGSDFVERQNLTKNFYIISGVKPDDMLLGWRDKATLFGFVGAIAASVVFSIPLVKCLIFYTAFLVASGCLTVNEIKRRFPIEIWLLVVSALTLANALENTGVAMIIANNIHLLLAGQGVMWAFVVIFLVTLLVTELITNNAAAVLVFPIAYNVAIGLDVSPMPFIMAVAFAASGSFISPYGYQTNVMVFNAGNYNLMHFVRFGLPVSVVYSVTCLYMIPLVFPF
ncbi:MAG: SLC13 family permease [Algicola sp.]|nr:SLC13 family permease [Algicola sp.]